MLLLSLATSVRAAGIAEADKNPMFTAAGDALQFGLPLAAFGLTYLLDGGEDVEESGDAFLQSSLSGADVLALIGAPRHDLLVAMLRTEIATYSLKYAVDAQRPNGGDQSFPSGHTAAAFAGAEFIRKQYGLWWGVPAYLTASYVGWSRVESDNHWTRDVLAGAAIGILSNHDLGALQLPFGSLTVAPAAFAPSAHAGPALSDDPLAMNPAFDAGARAVAPGLRLELRF